MCEKIRQVVWRSEYITKQGAALENWLTRMNFKPGKFIVIDSEYIDKYKVVYVESEK